MLWDGECLFRTKKGKPVELPVPLAPLADTHGHLTSFRRTEPFEALARAALAGVRLLVVPVDPVDDVTDVPAFLAWLDEVVEKARALLARLAQEGVEPPVVCGYEDAPALVDNVYYVAGVHPYGAQAYRDDAGIRMRLARLLDGERCVGVGEFGVDYGPWNKLSADVQEEAFRAQLRLAHEHELPCELHLRDANDDKSAQGHADALRILREEGIPAAGCDLHCYTSGPDVMRPFVELGCHIAFGGAATFGRSDDIRAAAAVCPSNRILSETDSPYMAPMPLRGSECEPAMVALTVALLADVRQQAAGVEPEQTYRDLWSNANAFFGLG